MFTKIKNYFLKIASIHFYYFRTIKLKCIIEFVFYTIGWVIEIQQQYTKIGIVIALSSMKEKASLKK